MAMKMSLKFNAHHRQIIHYRCCLCMQGKLNINFLFGTQFDTLTAIHEAPSFAPYLRSWFEWENRKEEEDIRLCFD